MQGRFKNRGQDILRRSPASMKEFLGDEPGAVIAHSNEAKDEVRLHVHIRKDLADRLFEMVFRL